MSAAKNKKNTINSEKLALDLLDSSGKKKESIKLDEAIFGGKISLALLQQAVATYVANRRIGQACTKTKGQKRGGGRKPWRQKGTGRARVGSIRSPLWRGGGVTFGPKPRSYYKKFPARMRVLALKSAFCAKLIDEQVILLDQLDLTSAKAKDFASLVSGLGVNDKKTCFVIVDFSENIKRASANFKKVSLAKASDLNALGVLDCNKLVLTKDSLDIIKERIKKWI